MIKKVSVLTMAAAALALAAPTARAETIVLKANVPFDFVVAGRTLPSGEYRFVQSDNRAVVLIESTAGEHLATVVCHGVPQTASEAKRLVFHRHGSQRFLKVIRGGDGTGIYLPRTPIEAQAQRQALANGGGTPAGMP